MENEIKKLADTFDMKRPDGTQLGKRDKRKSVSLIRYADDFVILHEDLSVVQECQKVIAEWLKGMGLELKPSKTRVTHTLEDVNREKAGFNFLGFHIQQYKTGKYTSGKVKGKLLGFKTIITPSQESQKKHYRKVAEVIEKYQGLSQASLIKRLNPIIRGWCNYFSTVVSQKIFERIWHLIIFKLIKWGIKRHRNKGKKWVYTRYFSTVGGDKWTFAIKHQGQILMRLIQHSETPIVRHVKVKGDSSPYDGNLIYWSVRMGKHPEMPKGTALLLKKQKRKCPHCGLFFKDGDLMEVDHIIPKSKGGKEEYKNYQLLHRHCHDEKTRIDQNYSVIHSISEEFQWIEDVLVMC
ncbi:MAG: DNA polymerase, partial [Symploca sp. SIO3E6]|nr:DNA polymerase [Caldora sp. SIO3E6]